MNELPADYKRLPLPDFGNDFDSGNSVMSWYGVVADRARIVDPDFHGGKTEAIRLLFGWKREDLPGLAWRVNTPIVGEWIEFRNFKEANDFVQAYKRLSR